MSSGRPVPSAPDSRSIVFLFRCRRRSVSSSIVPQHLNKEASMRKPDPRTLDEILWNIGVLAFLGVIILIELTK